MKINDIIRNKKPYFGEPVWKIVDEDENQVYVVQGPSKYGLWDNPKYRMIMFKHQMVYYRRARLYEIVFLYIIGCYRVTFDYILNK